MDSSPSVFSSPCCAHIHLHIPCDIPHRSAHFVRLCQKRLSVVRPSSIDCPSSILFCRAWTSSTLPSYYDLPHCGRSHKLPVCVIPPLKIHGACGNCHIYSGWYGTSSSLPLLLVAASPPIPWSLRWLCNPARAMGVHS